MWKIPLITDEIYTFSYDAPNSQIKSYEITIGFNHFVSNQTLLFAVKSSMNAV